MLAPNSWAEAAALGMSPADWQEVCDFKRYLEVAGPVDDSTVLQHDRAYAWVWYINGICGAPPLMREGDDN